MSSKGILLFKMIKENNFNFSDYPYDSFIFSEYDKDDPNVFQDDEDMEQEVTDDGKKCKRR